MPYLAPDSHYSTMKYLTEKYGPVFKLRLGSVDTVVITDYHLIKKAFQSQELTYRPNLFYLEFASQGFHGSRLVFQESQYLNYFYIRYINQQV